jgi:hypothetical protein
VSKYDPELEERFFEELFPYMGAGAERMARRLAVKSHEFYMCDEFGVEVVDDGNE